MNKPNPSSLEWIKLVCILLFGSIGIVLAIRSRDLRYVAEAVGCSQLAAAVIAVPMCSTELKGLRGRLFAIGIVAVMITSAASAIILLHDANSRLSDQNAELSILDVINHEPRLIAADISEVSECFERNATVVEVSNPNGARAWYGTDEIVDRYKKMAHEWKLISMHACPEFCGITQHHASVKATTYVYEPGRDEKWHPALSEVWKLHRGSDGRWKISAFYYGISPKDVGNYLQETTEEDQR